MSPDPITEGQARVCIATTKKGKRCTRYATEDLDTCIAHAPEEVRQSKGFGGPQEGAGRPKTPRVTDVYAEELHRRVGEHLDELIGRLVAIALDAQRTVVVGTGPNARTEIAPDQGLQLAALRELNDRILGRPKQTTELSGPEGGPVELVEIPDTDAYRQRVASLAAAVLGVGHSNGNGNGLAHVNGNGHHG